MKLWSLLIRKQFYNLKFYRQYSIENYIIDFYCPKVYLGIEIDGMSHDENKYTYDRNREEKLREIGIDLLRFTEYEAVSNIDNVMQTIENYYLIVGTLPNPLLPREGLI